jgi:hypothetical protein
VWFPTSSRGQIHDSSILFKVQRSRIPFLLLNPPRLPTANYGQKILIGLIHLSLLYIFQLNPTQAQDFRENQPQDIIHPNHFGILLFRNFQLHFDS